MSASQLQELGLVVRRPEAALICRACRRALFTERTAVWRHLDQAHQRDESHRKRLDCLTNLTLTDLSQLPPRPDHSPEDPFLQVTSGFACQHCPVRTGSEEILWRHLSKCHQIWRVNAQVGQDYQECRLQQWAPTGSKARHMWIVTPADEASPVVLGVKRKALNGGGRQGRVKKRKLTVEPRQRALIAQAALPAALLASQNLERQRLLPTDLSQTRVHHQLDQIVTTTPWLQRTAWIEVFGRAPRDLLVTMTHYPRTGETLDFGTINDQEFRIPAEAEGRICLALDAADRVFDRCEETSSRSDQVYKRPFQLVSQATSTEKYRRLWKRCLALCLRWAHLPPRRRSQLHPIVFRPDQQNLLSRIWEILESSSQPTHAHLDIDDGDVESDSESEYENDGFDESDEESDEESDTGSDIDEEDSLTTDSAPLSPLASTPSFLDDPLTRLIYQFSLSLCMDEFHDGQPASSPFIVLTGIFGLTPKGDGYQYARTYTPQISAFIYLQRLLFLQHSRDTTPNPSQQLTIFQQIQRRYMCLGCPTPLGEHISLLQYGRQLLRAEGPTFQMWWSDDNQTLRFQEHSLHVNQFRQFARSLLDLAREKCDGLMYSWTPPVALHQIHDTMSQTTPGYSFVQDPHNGLQTGFLDLSTRAYYRSPTPVFHGEQWAKPTAMQYLKDHEDFLALLYQLLFVWGGQSPRPKELRSLEMVNGPATSRGFFVHNGAMAYITRYHKAQRSTGHQFHVARFLPEPIGHLVFYYLVYIRPYVDMLLRQCFGQSQPMPYLFTSNPIVARQRLPRLWTSADLTRCLRSSSRSICGFPMGSQIYRQISIAITEKFVTDLAQPINPYQDRGPTAPLDVGFAWQSGHRPYQRGTNYGIDGAFPTALQPRLLRVFEQASRRWHAFLASEFSSVRGLPSADAEPRFSQSLFSGPRSLAATTVEAIGGVLESTDPAQSLRVPSIFGVPAPREVVDSSTLTTSPPRPPPSPPLSPPVVSPPQSPRELFDSVFTHFPRYRVIVCHECPDPFAVVPGQVQRHLKDHHDYLTITQCNQIVEVVKSLTDLAWELSQVVFPDADEAPILGLRIISNLLRCTCGFLCTQLAYIQKHCKKEHGWVNVQKRGRTSQGGRDIRQQQTPNRIWVDGCFGQQFFRYSRWKKIFQVTVTGT